MSLADFAVTQADAIDRTLETLEYRYMHPTHVWGYRSGFERLDVKTGGIRFRSDEIPGEANELTVVAGRSGVGKSSFGMSVAINVARTFQKEYPGLQVRISLLEMEPETCMKRLIGQIAGVPIKSLSSGYYSPEERRRVQKAGKILKDLPIVYMRGAHNVDKIRDFVTVKSKTGMACGFWLVDHIGLVPTDLANKTGNQSFSLGQVSRALHDLARNYAPGYVLAQLNRESMKRKDPRPTAADLYGSDRIMQDTDNLILLHRPELYAEKSPIDAMSEGEVAEAIIEKQRDGEANIIVPMTYIPRYALWNDLKDEEEIAA
ncbi:DnaB-like helicase C-terminal domain-containing protein [Ktedonospora formicarum]|uniref:SF4 helicase domain-containing protein n=1 Tax=Ktedonospora formicarum TaxID=2778364 RepID=A0A8J3I1U2_9CHLR|nr:DnaB-like helicase C-terminal domain-containing protein [Ktedonospora formicarum]GHO45158.1 hypothetical protein KSX_33210 [Ktedonospora formicarum]